VRRRPLSIVRWVISSSIATVPFWASPSLAQSVDRPSPSPSTAVAQGAVSPVGVVHIDAPQQVTLEINQAGSGWVGLCDSPCDRPVPLNAAYRITGGGIRDSSVFQIDPLVRTTLQVEPTSSAARAIAVVLTVVGGAGLLPIIGVTAIIAGGEIFGAILICPLVAAFETVKSQQASEYGNCLGAIATFFAPAYKEPWVFVPALAGVAALTGGIVGLATTPQTSVRQSTTGPAASLLFPPPAALGAVRLPQPILCPVVEARF
jgi:hypothetical protein